jgi:hypothetical protein
MCRLRIDEQLSSYAEVKRAAGDCKEIASFESIFLENMVLSLDSLFGHRARGKEGKDGNPLNEVRMICGTLMKGESRLLPDSTIKYDPAKSILGTRMGEPIPWTPEGVGRLCHAFLEAIETKYP